MSITKQFASVETDGSDTIIIKLHDASADLPYLISRVVEVVFVYPGIGQSMVDAVRNRDVPVIQASALIFAVTCIVLNLIADVISIVSNPRLPHPRWEPTHGPGHQRPGRQRTGHASLIAPCSEQEVVSRIPFEQWSGEFWLGTALLAFVIGSFLGVMAAMLGGMTRSGAGRPAAVWAEVLLRRGKAPWWSNPPDASLRHNRFWHDRL